MVDTNIVVVGIAGGTASGKTTLARKVVAALGSSECLLITHDRYYHDVENPSTFNYDHPDALETSLLVEHVRTLRAGQAAELPDYDFSSHTRKPEAVTTEAQPTIIVEGILALEDEDLRALFDLMIFVDTPDDLRLARRIRRDVATRARDIEEVLGRWLTTVRPMHIRYVEPCRTYADVVLPGVGLLEPLVDSICGAIERCRLEVGAGDDGELEELGTDDLVYVDSDTWTS
ncbi:MAG TPA: uridine kinase [Myxococcota bacterium]|nr:uridine kinase [Myxococcota bacterium]